MPCNAVEFISMNNFKFYAFTRFKLGVRLTPNFLRLTQMVYQGNPPSFGGSQSSRTEWRQLSGRSECRAPENHPSTGDDCTSCSWPDYWPTAAIGQPLSVAIKRRAQATLGLLSSACFVLCRRGWTTINESLSTSVLLSETNVRDIVRADFSSRGAD